MGQAAAAGDVPLATWLVRVGRRAAGLNVVARIEVARDDGDWHWVAYHRDGHPLSMAGIKSVRRDRVGEVARKRAEEHGLEADDAEIVVEG